MGGRIDILINAAGINRRYWLEDFPLDMWDEVIATNLNGTVYCSQLVGQYMLRQGYGRIVNLASMNSFVAGPKMAAYVASKGGIAQVTKAFANEWGGRGIRVNAIAPGYIETDQTLPLQQDPKRYQEILDRIAVGRWGKPDDLVGPVLMLCFEAAPTATDWSCRLTAAIWPVNSSCPIHQQPSGILPEGRFLQRGAIAQRFIPRVRTRILQAAAVRMLRQSPRNPPELQKAAPVRQISWSRYSSSSSVSSARDSGSSILHGWRNTREVPNEVG